jgi:hypothetical protein
MIVFSRTTLRTLGHSITEVGLEGLCSGWFNAFVHSFLSGRGSP